MERKKKHEILSKLNTHLIDQRTWADEEAPQMRTEEIERLILVWRGPGRE